MKFKDYKNCPIYTVKYHATKEMQHLFGFTKSEFNTWCSDIRISNFFDKNIVITKDMLDYLDVPRLAPHLVNKNVGDLTTCRFRRTTQGPLQISSDESSMLWRELATAWNDSIDNYNDVFYDALKIWRKEVEEPFLQALVNKMDTVEFSDDESDTDGVSSNSDESSDTFENHTLGGHERVSFVVCEYEGDYSDYECEPVAVFDTKHKARKFIKSIHKKMWTTKCINSDEYKKEIRTLSPKLMIKDAYNEPHYNIYSVPTL